MDIHFTVAKDTTSWYVDSFVVTRQATLCRFVILSLLQEKVLEQLSEDPEDTRMGSFEFASDTYPISVTWNRIETM